MAESRPTPAKASALIVTTFGLVVAHNGTSVELRLSPEEIRAVATVMHSLSTALGADAEAAMELLLRAGVVAPANA